jgi:predicted pyridoxine 5'-phosphate oxidase superfamily flavin-nucleotide-binding protein
MSDIISTIGELEAVVGAAPLPVKMKIIDHLDAAAAEWIAASPLAFIAIGNSIAPRVCAAGGPRGFASVRGKQTLVIPLSALDDPSTPEVGRGAGVLFLIPGLGETLRANGRISATTNSSLEIAIEECFVHCAKALIRSDFWNASAAPAPPDPAAFVNSTRFLALATMDHEGRIDISPKGDPAGLLIRLDGERATLAERPGNRLAFGYRNIIGQPNIAALAIIPGATSLAVIEGRAHLSSNEAKRKAFEVDGKTPILATVIEGVRPHLRESAALQRAALWTGQQQDPGIDPAATFVAHVKLNKESGVQATMLRLAVNRGLVASGLKANYKAELY